MSIPIQSKRIPNKIIQKDLHSAVIIRVDTLNNFLHLLFGAILTEKLFQVLGRDESRIIGINTIECFRNTIFGHESLRFNRGRQKLRKTRHIQLSEMPGRS